MLQQMSTSNAITHGCVLSIELFMICSLIALWRVSLCQLLTKAEPLFNHRPWRESITRTFSTTPALRFRFSSPAVTRSLKTCCPVHLPDGSECFCSRLELLGSCSCCYCSVLHFLVRCIFISRKSAYSHGGFALSYWDLLAKNIYKLLWITGWPDEPLNKYLCNQETRYIVRASLYLSQGLCHEF